MAYENFLIDSKSSKFWWIFLFATGAYMVIYGIYIHIELQCLQYCMLCWRQQGFCVGSAFWSWFKVSWSEGSCCHCRKGSIKFIADYWFASIWQVVTSQASCHAHGEVLLLVHLLVCKHLYHLVIVVTVTCSISTLKYLSDMKSFSIMNLNTFL